MTHRRRIRLVCEPDHDHPWVVQYDRPDGSWADVIRFPDRPPADRYLAIVTGRDPGLEEGAR